MKNKQNLVLIHSFPTNSIILKGLNNFLSNYINVYFIDLPGFNNNYDKKFKISFENYANCVQLEIDKLKLNTYWVGGCPLDL